MIQTAWKHTRTLLSTERRRRGLLLVTLLLSLGLLVWGIVGRWNELQSYDWRLNWPSLALGEVAYLAALALPILAWTILMQTLHAQSTWRQDAKFFFYSWLARRLPTPAPYLATRVLLYEEIGVPKRVTSVGLVWENVLLIASGALLAILLLPLTPLMNPHIFQLPVILAAIMSLTLVLVPSLLTRLINRCLAWFHKAPLPFFLNQAVATLLLVIYAMVWFAGGVLLFFLIKALHPIGWSSFPLVLQSWVLSGLISYLTFFLPLGLGLREVTLAYLLSLTIPLPVAVVVTVLIRLWIMLNELLLSVVAFKA